MGRWLLGWKMVDWAFGWLFSLNFSLHSLFLFLFPFHPPPIRFSDFGFGWLSWLDGSLVNERMGG